MSRCEHQRHTPIEEKEDPAEEGGQKRSVMQSQVPRVPVSPQVSYDVRFHTCSRASCRYIRFLMCGRYPRYGHPVSLP